VTLWKKISFYFKFNWSSWLYYSFLFLSRHFNN